MPKAFEKTSITEQTFSKNLDIVKGNNRATRRIIQGLALCSLDVYKKHGQTGKATQIYKACQLIGAHGQFKLFIEHSSNMKLEDEGKKNAKFIKRNKQPADYEVTDWWYQYEVPEIDDADKPKRHADKMLETLIKSLNNGIKDHRMSNDVEAQALVNYLKAYKGFNEQVSIAPEEQAKQA